MKKTLACLAAGLLLVTSLSACASRPLPNSSASASNAEDAQKLSVVCTNFPEYDFVRQIVGDKLYMTQINDWYANFSDYDGKSVVIDGYYMSPLDYSAISPAYNT